MKNRMMKLLGIVAVAGAAFTWTHISGSTSSAHAADRQIGGGECRDSYSATLQIRTGAFGNPNSHYVGVYCGIPSDSTLRHRDIARVTLYGHNTNAMSTRACVQFFNTSGAHCGPSIGWDPGTGTKVMTGGYLSGWRFTPMHFPYLVTMVPPSSHIYGIRLDD